jgi:hypothetical protein
MAKIIDPSDLNRNTEVVIDPTAIPPAIGLEITGNLSTDGVSLQALYSFCKEQWKTQTDLIKYPFPIVAITPEQFEFQDDWIPSGQSTIDLFRDAGFAVISAGTSTEEYIGVITLGDVSDAQVYYAQVSGTTPETIDVVLTGTVNQAVKVYGDVDNGSFDYRDYFTIFAREQGKLYDQANQTDIGVTLFTYQAYRFPLSTSDDLKITTGDTSVGSDTPYTDMDITYLSGNTFLPWVIATTYDPYAVVQDHETPARWWITVAGGLSAGDDTDLGGGSDTTVTWASFSGEREIGTDNWYAYNIIIDADVGGTTPVATTAEIYTKVQYDLRQIVDIDEDINTVVSGKTADPLLTFVGDRLDTQPGVFIDDHLISDESNMEFYDVNGVSRKFPFVATGSINWNDNLQNDTDGIFKMFFTSANSNDYGTASALIVNDNDGLEITGVTSASPKYDFTFDYAGNQQGGRTFNTDAPVTVVAIGYDTAQYVKTTGTIFESTTNSVSLVAALERNYSNPA